MSGFHSHFKSDPRFDDERWQFDVLKPLLKESCVLFAVYEEDFHKAKFEKKPYAFDPSSRYAREKDERFAVVTYELDSAAEEMQERAWSFVLENSAIVEAALLTKLQTIHSRCLTELFEENLPDGFPSEKRWERITSAIPRYETAIQSFFKLVGVSLATSGLDVETSFVGFEFQSAWDQDHGLEIVMHKERVLCAAGMTEMFTPGSDVVAGIKATQEYELDAGDLKI